MKRWVLYSLFLVGLSRLLVFTACGNIAPKIEEKESIEESKTMSVIKLPSPRLTGQMSLEDTIRLRRSVREFKNTPLSLEQIGQLLWAAQGLDPKTNRFRNAPSAGATYPMELYVTSSDGLYHYQISSHSLKIITDKDLRNDLSQAALGQPWVAQAPIDIIIAADYSRTTSRYGQRGIRYVHIEAGHIAQNIHLQAVSLGLGSVPVGAFNDNMVKKLLGLPGKLEPLYIIPIGYIR